MWDRWVEASVPKTSWILAVVSVQHRLVTDRQTHTTDRQTHDDSKYRASIASRGKNVCAVFDLLCYEC